MNVNEIVGPPPLLLPPPEHWLFVLIIPAVLPFPQPDDWAGHDVTPPVCQERRELNRIHWLLLLETKYLI